MRARSSILLKLFVALLLVFSQQQAMLHALGHDFERIADHQKSTGAGDTFCADCVAVAQLGHADGVAQRPFVPSAQAAIDEVLPSATVVLLPFATRYQSRAPPRFS